MRLKSFIGKVYGRVQDSYRWIVLCGLFSVVCGVVVAGVPVRVLATTFTTNSSSVYIDTAYSYASVYNGLAQPVYLSSAGTIQSISACTNNAGHASETSTIKLIADNAGSPDGGSVIATATAQPGDNINYTTFTFANESFSAGNYWVSLSGDANALYRPCGLDTGTEPWIKYSGTWQSFSSFGKTGQEGLTITYTETGGGGGGTVSSSTGLYFLVASTTGIVSTLRATTSVSDCVYGYSWVSTGSSTYPVVASSTCSVFDYSSMNVAFGLSVIIFILAFFFGASIYYAFRRIGFKRIL